MDRLTNFSFDTSVLRKGKHHLYAIAWVITIVVFCKAILFQKGHTSSKIESTKSITPNSSSQQLYGVHNPKTIDIKTSEVLLNIGSQQLNVSTSEKVAVIVETRTSGALIPLILHFASVLGPTWPIVVYTELENYGSFSTSASFLQYRRSGRITVRPLPTGAYFPNWNSVSDFLTAPWLWEDLAPADHVLMFQADSILCANAVRVVDDYFEWDLIGAPIAPRWGKGYNGGLSLRRRSSILRVLKEWTYSRRSKPHPEDQWFYARMSELAAKDAHDGVENGIKLPSMEVARTFAVETIDHPSPLGFHQPTRFIQKHMQSLDLYCPEYRLATKERVKS